MIGLRTLQRPADIDSCAAEDEARLANKARFEP